MSDIENKENLFCCPITLDSFKEPVVIPDCGHTFDRASLKSTTQKKCPLCDNVYTGNPDTFPINWIVVSFLDLDIKREPDARNIMNYNADMAIMEARNYITENTQKYVKAILINISELAKKGKTFYECNLANVEITLLPHIVEELKCRKFIVKDNSYNVYVTWK